MNKYILWQYACIYMYFIDHVTIFTSFWDLILFPHIGLHVGFSIPQNVSKTLPLYHIDDMSTVSFSCFSPILLIKINNLT